MDNPITSGPPVAIVDGCRTPFFGSPEAAVGLSATDLARWVLAAAGHRLPCPRGEVDLVIVGQSRIDPEEADPGRTAVLAAGWPEATPAGTIKEGWPAGLTALLTGAQAVASGRAQVVVVVGTEFFVRSADPLDPVTGLTWGKSAERLAKRLGITREDQDQYARTSHLRAVAAQKAGRFEKQIIPLYLPPDFAPRATDTTPWLDSDLDRLADLPPAHDPLFGTVTAATGPRPAAGATALVLMSQARVESLGLEPRGWVRAWANAAGDPLEEQCLGAALALSALDRPETRVIEMDESCAAAVLAATDLAAVKDGFSPLDAAKLNAWGGSLALGHPAGATGGRLILTALQRMKAQEAASAVVATGSTGAHGQAIFLERT
jgi:acetyl-CoA acetyltransferase